MGRTAALTWRQYEEFLGEWSNQLASKEALTIAGRPVCSILNLTDFSACYGVATFSLMLKHARRFLTGKIGREPYLLGLVGRIDDRNLLLANALPIDAVTGYGLLPNWLGAPVQDYADLIRQRVAEWHSFQGDLNIPFLPVVCAGWDASIRGRYRGVLTEQDGYPYSPVVTGASPELFGEFLDSAISFNRDWHPETDVVFLHAWNEWTECSVLEPSVRDGDAYLAQVVKRSVAVPREIVPTGFLLRASKVITAGPLDTSPAGEDAC
jgi:hypothetical protein